MKALLSVLRAALIVTITLPITPTAAESAGTPRVGVLCVLSASSAFPFTAGNDRCFKEINGRTVAPMHVTACFLEGADWARVTFVFSAIPAPECGGLAAYGIRANRAQYTPALDALAQHERQFFLDNEPSED